MRRRIWLVGESDPHSDLEVDALHPGAGTVGGRLCREILGLEPREYISKFVRRNLLLAGEKWSASLARATADFIREESRGAPLALLGRRVAEAFGTDFVPFRVRSGVLTLPHPSGRCRLWNDPNSYATARAALRALERSATWRRATS
jgi:hypothetical protein